MPPVDGVLRAMLIDALEVIFVSPKSPIQAVKSLLMRMFPCWAVSAMRAGGERSDTHTLDIRMDERLTMEVLQSGRHTI